MEGLNNKGHTLEFIWLILKGKKEEELSQITPCDPGEFLLALRGPSDLLKEETSEAKWAKEAKRAKVIGVEASFWASPHKHGRWLDSVAGLRAGQGLDKAYWMVVVASHTPL